TTNRSGLGLGLQQPLETIGRAADHETENADLGLVDHRQFEPLQVRQGRLATATAYREETAADVTNGSVLVDPPFALAQGYATNVHLGQRAALIEPARNRISRSLTHQVFSPDAQSCAYCRMQTGSGTSCGTSPVRRRKDLRPRSPRFS